MRLKQTLIASACLFFFMASPLFAQNTIIRSVYFDSGKSELKSEEQNSLQSIITEIRQYADVDLRIEAFTDDKGSEEFNQQLAQRRAEMVQSLLLGQQITPKKLEVRPVGEVALDNNSQKDVVNARQKNRRVDIAFTPFTLNSVADILQRWSEKSSAIIQRTIESQTENTIKGNNGVTLQIPSEAFVFTDGTPVKSKVQVTLTEALRPADWIMNNLSTVSESGQVMSSGGMFRIDATAEGKAVKIKKGKQINVSVNVNATAYSDKMQMFYGSNHNTISNREAAIAWQDKAQPTLIANNDNINNEEQSSKTVMTAEKYEFLREAVKQIKGTMRVKDYPMKATYFSDFDIKRLVVKPYRPIKPMLGMEEPQYKPILDTIVYKKNRSGRRKAKNMRKRLDMIAQQQYDAEKRKYNGIFNIYKRRLKVFERDSSRFLKDSITYAENLPYFKECVAKVKEEEKRFISTLVTRDINYFSIRKGKNIVDSIKLSLLSSPNYSIAKEIEYTRPNFNITAQVDILNRNRSLVGHSMIYRLKLSLLQSQKANKDRIEAYGTIDETVYRKALDSILKETELYRTFQQAKADFSDKCLEIDFKNNAVDVKQYVGSVTELGWINFDIFYQYNKEKAKPLVVIESGEARSFLVCKSQSIILPLAKINAQQQGFPLVPSELEYTIVSIKTKDGFPMLSIEEVKNLSDTPIVLKYEKVSVTTLRERLETYL